MEENENTVMPVSKRPAPKKIFIPPPKPESQKNYKEIKVTTKEGSIESGVQLSKGTITVKKIHGKGLMIEKDDIVYEMVTKRGSGLRVSDKKIFAYFYNSIPLLLVPDCGKIHYFGVTEPEKENKPKFFWYSHHYTELFDVVPQEIELTDYDELIVYNAASNITRPSLAPIEASEDTKLYDLIPSSIERPNGMKLFLGSQDAATNEEGLDNNGVLHILCIATGISYQKNPKYTYKTVEILDAPEIPIIDSFNECFEFIDHGIKNGGVLVHCNAGVSRSASVCIAYIMKNERKTFKEAHDLVKAVKKDIKPNEGFVKQLLAFEKTLNLS